MFNKPSEQHNGKTFSVNVEFWNKIAQTIPFFARTKCRPTIHRFAKNAGKLFQAG
jgi:hypothetical protein